jgi:hypothetical protein
MFDRQAEAIARFDELFERRYPSSTRESAALVDGIRASWRAQNRAAAALVTAIGQLFGYRLSRCSDTEDWAIDTEEAVRTIRCLCPRRAHPCVECEVLLP